MVILQLTHVQILQLTHITDSDLPLLAQPQADLPDVDGNRSVSRKSGIRSTYDRD